MSISARRKLFPRTGSALRTWVAKASIRKNCLALPPLESRRKAFDVYLIHKLLHFTPYLPKCKLPHTSNCTAKLCLPPPKTRLRAMSTKRIASTWKLLETHPVSANTGTDETCVEIIPPDMIFLCNGLMSSITLSDYWCFAFRWFLIAFLLQLLCSFSLKRFFYALINKHKQAGHKYTTREPNLNST